jgi:gamma-glutamyltranspeptidase/glutathione hydrolase
MPRTRSSDDAGAASRPAPKQSAAAATEPVASAAALAALIDGGTAIDAVVAGFFAAAGVHPGALLGPVQILVAGTGVGARAFDGRPRQPGSSAPRPRGFRPEDEVPLAALAAVPASLGALALALAHDGVLTLTRLARAGVETARGRGAKGRATVLAEVGRLGATALGDPSFVRPLVGAAGRAQGGLLGEEDLRSIVPASEPPRIVSPGGRGALFLPWQRPAEPGRPSHAIVAGDYRGVLAALAYAPDDDGLRVPELELVLPRDAVPVRRGVARTRPGEPLAAHAPIAIATERDVAVLAIGASLATSLGDDEALSAWGGSAPAAVAIASLRSSLGGAPCVGIVRSPRGDEMTALFGLSPVE